MTISRRIARPLLASIFISGGLDAVHSPEGKVKVAAAVTEPLRAKIPSLPEDTATLVRWNGMVQVGAGGLLAIGRFRRLAALALIASVIPTTYAGHRFWEEVDDETRAQQRIHFLKNLGLLGGLILAATDTEGAPSLGWRAHRRADQLGAIVGSGRTATSTGAHHASVRLSEAGHHAGRRATKAAAKGRDAGRQANRAARRASRHANETVADAAKSGVSVAAPYVRHANESALNAARSAFETAEPYVVAGVERASELFSKASDHLTG
jgi:putative oxidoreductase